MERVWGKTGDVEKGEILQGLVGFCSVKILFGKSLRILSKSMI